MIELLPRELWRAHTRSKEVNRLRTEATLEMMCELEADQRTHAVAKESDGTIQERFDGLAQTIDERVDMLKGRLVHPTLPPGRQERAQLDLRWKHRRPTLKDGRTCSPIGTAKESDPGRWFPDAPCNPAIRRRSHQTTSRGVGDTCRFMGRFKTHPNWGDDQGVRLPPLFSIIPPMIGAASRASRAICSAPEPSCSSTFNRRRDIAQYSLGDGNGQPRDRRVLKQRRERNVHPKPVPHPRENAGRK